MKKILSILFFLFSFFLSSCKQEWTETYYQTLFIASTRYQTGGYIAKIIGQDRMIVEAHDVEDYGKYWFVYDDPIIGFDEVYKEGYEYIIGVIITSRQAGNRNTYAWTTGKTFTLDGIIMKNKADTFIDPEKVQYTIMD